MLTIEQRFYSRIKPYNSEDECHIWDAYFDDAGYGKFSYKNRKYRRAHRVAWELVNGIIPPGKVIRHMCHNRACVNIKHLKIGTQADNVQDTMDRFRAEGIIQ